MKPLTELLETDDPGWPRVLSWLEGARRTVDVLPVERAAGEETLLRLQVSARSTLGAIALETGGILVDDGWLRLLGGGSERLPGLALWAGLDDTEPVEPVAGGLAVAYDAVGGFFFLLERTRRVHSFMPDALAWQDTGLTYSEFVHWTFHGDLDAFYGGLRWPGWREEVRGLPPDVALLLEPAPSARAGRSPAGAHRREAPIEELHALYPGSGIDHAATREPRS